jgi:hypothetical protein
VRPVWLISKAPEVVISQESSIENLDGAFGENIHFHEQVMTLVEVALGQPDAHRQDGSSLNASSFDPIQRRVLALFVQSMLD